MCINMYFSEYLARLCYISVTLTGTISPFISSRPSFAWDMIGHDHGRLNLPPLFLMVC